MNPQKSKTSIELMFGGYVALAQRWRLPESGPEESGGDENPFKHGFRCAAASWILTPAADLLQVVVVAQGGNVTQYKHSQSPLIKVEQIGKSWEDTLIEIEEKRHIS
ncbi:unnamed protein product [Caenorhabditis auriculariae]|uniref:Uncharacterized protein n=1 Tax=Caenorhabditis auriculariae TaxID=2777116 RepID=A0A8S1HSI2_9PELO|nr:unnamed protein product [Caenorhabditis auriculariae]